MAHFRPTEYEYTVSYFETLEFLATLSKRIRRETDYFKRKELIREYIPFYCAWSIEYSKFNAWTPLAREISKKRYGNASRGPRIFTPYSWMTKEERAEHFRKRG